MPNPKRKFSKARSSQRRAVYYASAKIPEVTECPTCGTPHQYHRVCPGCGYYRGRKLVEVKEEA